MEKLRLSILQVEAQEKSKKDYKKHPAAAVAAVSDAIMEAVNKPPIVTVEFFKAARVVGYENYECYRCLHTGHPKNICPLKPWSLYLCINCHKYVPHKGRDQCFNMKIIKIIMYQNSLQMRIIKLG